MHAPAVAVKSLRNAMVPDARQVPFKVDGKKSYDNNGRCADDRSNALT